MKPGQVITVLEGGGTEDDAYREVFYVYQEGRYLGRIDDWENLRAIAEGKLRGER